MTTTDRFIVRHATASDGEDIARLEGICFPEAEAASPKDILERVRTYPEHFTLVVSDCEIISVVNGPVTVGKDLEDHMYHDVSCHDALGSWQMIFGVETHPSYQRMGVASLAMTSFLEYARSLGLKGAVLTCKKELISYYERFGFINEGVSSSVHGGAVWYQMRAIF